MEAIKWTAGGSVSRRWRVRNMAFCAIPGALLGRVQRSSHMASQAVPCPVVRNLANLDSMRHRALCKTPLPQVHDLRRCVRETRFCISLRVRVLQLVVRCGKRIRSARFGEGQGRAGAKQSRVSTSSWFAGLAESAGVMRLVRGRCPPGAYGFAPLRIGAGKPCRSKGDTRRNRCPKIRPRACLRVRLTVGLVHRPAPSKCWTRSRWRVACCASP